MWTSPKQHAIYYTHTMSTSIINLHSKVEDMQIVEVCFKLLNPEENKLQLKEDLCLYYSEADHKVDDWSKKHNQYSTKTRSVII